MFSPSTGGSIFTISFVNFEPSIGFVNGEAVFGMIVPAPEDMVTQSLQHQPFQQIGIFGSRPEKPCAERFVGVIHAEPDSRYESTSATE